MANDANPIPANPTSTVSTFVGNRRRNRAYSIFPIYSKNKDQLGLFRGYISPFPRTSGPVPGTAGIKKSRHSVFLHGYISFWGLYYSPHYCYPSSSQSIKKEPKREKFYLKKKMKNSMLYYSKTKIF